MALIAPPLKTPVSAAYFEKHAVEFRAVATGAVTIGKHVTSATVANTRLDNCDLVAILQPSISAKARTGR